MLIDVPLTAAALWANQVTAAAIYYLYLLRRKQKVRKKDMRVHRRRMGIIYVGSSALTRPYWTSAVSCSFNVLFVVVC